MKEIIVDKAFVEPYFHGKKCKDYHMAVDIQNHMAFHFIGYFRKTDVTGNVQIINEKQNPYFKRLIDLRRPSESEPIMDYRRDIYLPITRIPCHKISNSLKKIIKSQDWNIDYSHSEMPNKIPDRETLEYYCEEDYPFFDSIEQWAYQFGLNQMLKDPNAAVVVLPINWDKEENEFYRPYSYVIPTRRVIDYSEGDYIVYDEDEGQTSEEITYTAKKLTIITNTQWFIVERDNKDEYSINLILQHNLGYLPAFIIGGEPVKLSEKKPLYESFISPILPELDAAAQEHSDLQAEIVQHVYSTMWYFQTQECNACMGTGNVVKDGKSTVCSQCEGSGQAKKSPYKDMILKPSSWDNQGNMPVPPAGYVVKPTEAAKLLDERVATHIYRALSAINMEFLAQRPLNESGTAKEVDRDELNNFVYSVAYHLVENVLQPIYFYVNEWRYKNVITDPALREKMLPHIPVPERYDLLTENIVGERLKQAIDGNFSSEIIKQLELEYVNKCFATNPEVRNVMNLKQQLDPFTGLGIEDKQNLYLAGDVAQRDFILSVYIDNFVNQAMENDDDFLNKEFPQQKSTIDKLVDEKVNEMKASTKIKNNLNEV